MASPLIVGAIAAVALLFSEALAADGAASFASGDYARARDEGRAAATAAGLSNACKAGLVLGSYFEGPGDRVMTLHRAIEDCAGAISTGDAGVDAYVSYALGVSFEAKRLRSRQYATASKRLLADAVRRFPDSAFAHGALAGWHANVARQGRVARIALGAGRTEARQGFQKALTLDPRNVAITAEYLRFLAVGDSDDVARARTLAQSAAALPSADAFEALMLERALLVTQSLDGAQRVRERLVETHGPFANFAGEKSPTPFEPPLVEGFRARAGSD